MSTLPVLLNEPSILILGGGSVAFQKATVLVNNAIKFSLISLDYCPEFENIDVHKITKIVELSDFEHCNIVVDATGSDDVGKLLEEIRKKRFILVNRVDCPDQCNFFFSSLLHCGSLKVAVSTDGASPTIGKIVRDKINAMLPQGLAEFVIKTKYQRQRGYIDPHETREQMMTLFTDVVLIECDSVSETLLTLQKHPQLCAFDVVLCQQQYLHPELTIESAQHPIKFVSIVDQKHSFAPDAAYTTLKACYHTGAKIGVLIQADGQFSHHAKKLCTRLKNDGINVKIGH